MSVASICTVKSRKDGCIKIAAGKETRCNVEFVSRQLGAVDYNAELGVRGRMQNAECKVMILNLKKDQVHTAIEERIKDGTEAEKSRNKCGIGDLF